MRKLLRPFLADHPGTPLGRGFPSGLTLREDGESHRAAWMRIIRADPCSYCGGPGGSLDHLEARSRVPRTGAGAHGCLSRLDQGGLHVWLNYAGACPSCNSGKSDRSLLDALYRRRWGASIDTRSHGVVSGRVPPASEFVGHSRVKGKVVGGSHAERVAYLEVNPVPRWNGEGAA